MSAIERMKNEQQALFTVQATAGLIRGSGYRLMACGEQFLSMPAESLAEAIALCKATQVMLQQMQAMYSEGQQAGQAEAEAEADAAAEQQGEEPGDAA